MADFYAEDNKDIVLSQIARNLENNYQETEVLVSASVMADFYAEDNKDILLSQIATDLENNYQEIEALNNSTENIILSQAVDSVDITKFVDKTLSQTMDAYSVGINSDFNFDLGWDTSLENIPPSTENKADIKIQPKNTFDRFAKPVSDEEIMELKTSKVNKNTARNTRWAVSIFNSWRESRKPSSIIPELRVMEKSVMAYWLTRFVMEVRNAKGQEYPPKTVYLIICGLLRHLRDIGVHDKNFLDKGDPQFTEFYSILDSKMKDLLGKGLGTETKQADPVSFEDEQKLWDIGAFGMKDSQTLQHTVYYYSCKLFGLRSRDEHRQLQCTQFKIAEDAQGLCIRFTGRDCKTYKGGLGQMSLTHKDIKHYCFLGQRCLASYFDTYLKALGYEGDFYRRPLPGGGIRYGNQPVGVNKIASFMKDIAEKSGLKENYIGHSGKRTCATQLYNCGIDEQEIMNRTGHRSAVGVRKYKQSSDVVHKRVSSTLDPFENNSETDSCMVKKKTVQPLDNFGDVGSYKKNWIPCHRRMNNLSSLVRFAKICRSLHEPRV